MVLTRNGGEGGDLPMDTAEYAGYGYYDADVAARSRAELYRVRQARTMRSDRPGP